MLPSGGKPIPVLTAKCHLENGGSNGTIKFKIKTIERHTSLFFHLETRIEPEIYDVSEPCANKR